MRKKQRASGIVATWGSIVATVVVIAGLLFVTLTRQGSAGSDDAGAATAVDVPQVAAGVAAGPAVGGTTAQRRPFDRTTHSTTDPASTG